MEPWQTPYVTVKKLLYIVNYLNVFLAGVKSGIHDRRLPAPLSDQSEGAICHSYSQIQVR